VNDKTSLTLKFIVDEFFSKIDDILIADTVKPFKEETATYLCRNSLAVYILHWKKVHKLNTSVNRWLTVRMWQTRMTNTMTTNDYHFTTEKPGVLFAVFFCFYLHFLLCLCLSYTSRTILIRNKYWTVATVR